MNWLWINLPIAAVFFLAMTAIPLWLAIRRTDTGPSAVAPVRVASTQAAEQALLASVSDARVRELAGVGQ